MTRKSLGGTFGALAVGMVLAGGPFACSSSAALAGPGGACTLVTDCQEGLVCCNANKGSFTCVASVSCLQPAGLDGDGSTPATGQGDDGAAGDGATSTVSDATVPPEKDTGASMEAEAPETGTPPVVDAGKPEDTGTEQEAASPPPKDGGQDALPE